MENITQYLLRKISGGADNEVNDELQDQKGIINTNKTKIS
jgi:hypothetical protein